MTDKIVTHQGKVRILDDDRLQTMQFDCAEDLAEFIVALAWAGQRTFPECKIADYPPSLTDHSMAARIATRLNLAPWSRYRDSSMFVWGVQKNKLVTERNDSTGIEK